MNRDPRVCFTTLLIRPVAILFMTDLMDEDIFLGIVAAGKRLDKTGVMIYSIPVPEPGTVKFTRVPAELPAMNCRRKCSPTYRLMKPYPLFTLNHFTTPLTLVATNKYKK